MARSAFKFLKYATVGTVTGGSLLVLQQNDWDVSSIGAVRFGRAAITVSIQLPLFS